MAPRAARDMVALAVAVGAIMFHKGKIDAESHLDVIRITISGGRKGG